MHSNFNDIMHETNSNFEIDELIYKRNKHTWDCERLSPSLPFGGGGRSGGPCDRGGLTGAGLFYGRNMTYQNWMKNSGTNKPMSIKHGKQAHFQFL